MKRLLFVVILLYSTKLFSQSFTFVAVKGNVKFEEKGATKKAESGLKLPDGSKIVLDKGSYAAIAYQGKQTLELKSEGIYSFQELQSKVTSSSSGITSKYVDYVVKNATSKPQANTMSNKGMVKRNLTGTGSVELFLPFNESYLLEDIVTFVWFPNKGVKEYTFVLVSPEGERVIEKVVRDTVLTLNLQPYNFKADACYYWQVSPKGTDKFKSRESCIKLYSKAERNNILQEVQSIQRDLGNTTISKAVLGRYYQDKKLFIEAYNMYKQAYDSGIPEYQSLYQDFLDAAWK